MSDKAAIGRPLQVKEAVAKVTGECRFTDDRILPGMLHGKILRSPHAHARILSVNTERAENLRGVRAVITGADTLGKTYGVIGYPGARADKHALAMEKVRYVGDEVAAVAAVDEDTAEEALRLIDVEYEPLPAVFYPEEAMKPGAPQLYDDCPRNVSVEQNWSFGDVDSALAEAHHVREDVFTTAPVQHCALEPHTSIAEWDSSGIVTLWASTAGPFVTRAQLATALGLPESRIRILSPYTGGHFGSKSQMFPQYLCCATLSRMTGRPVKITLSREEVFSTTIRRHPMTIRLRTGVDRDGALLGCDCRLVADGGAYQSSGAIVLLLSGSFLVATYRLPNIRYEAYRAYTNRSTSGAMRGFGAPQMRYAAECQLDLISSDLGLDPVEVRKKNAIHTGDELVNGFRINSCGLTECVERAAASSGWAEKRGKLPFGHGIGIACSSFISGHGMPLHAASGAVVKLHEDGGATLLTGVSNVGQGSDTVLAQIAAEELGVPTEDIRVVSGDTDITPVHAGSYSSRGTLWGGSAVKAAAIDAREQLLEVASEHLAAAPGDLVISDRLISVQGDSTRSLPFKEAIVRSMRGKGNPIIGKGYYKDTEAVMDSVSGRGNISPGYSFGAQVAEVKVDLETGKITVLNMVAAHDSGTTINPMGVEGQLHGSVHMGQGQALTEQLRMLDGGLILNPSLLDYHMPLAADAPNTEVIMVETEDPTLPNGAKEAGEGTTISTVPAIINAVYDAIGEMFTDLPADPEQVLRVLAKKQLPTRS